MQRSRQKSKYTAKTIFAELKDLANIHRRAKQGYREVLRKLMGRAATILDRIDNNDELGRKFALRLNRQNTRSNEARKSNLSTEVMAFIVGAKTRSARQMAFKYGRVLDVLRTAGVSADAIAKQIKSRGGIERIYQSSTNKQKFRLKKAKVISGSRPVQQNQPPQTEFDAAKKNNREILVTFYMNLADRDAILEVPKGTRVRLNTIRIGQPNAELKIRSIKIVR
jgi:hypothetical protein